MQGTKEAYDVGLAFGSAGAGRDVINQTSFVLSSDNDTALTLDDIANVNIGVRYTSVGAKLTTVAPAAPDAIDDTITTDEDNATNQNIPNSNLLQNDTDADGDTLTVVAINDDESLVGTQIRLSTGGLLTVNSDGSFDFDPNGEYEDLAVGETRTDRFTYRITDELIDPNNQGFDTATATITITGLNDDPEILILSGDSANETIVETNGNLSTSGTLTVRDVDLTDFVTASVISVATSGTDVDASLPSNSILQGMLTLNPAAPAVLLDSTENIDTLSWLFDSAGEAFNYLADDETLSLKYIVRAEDDNAATTDQTVTITIDGTNDRPVANDVSVSVNEDGISVQGSFIASDLDSSDILSYQILAQPQDAFGHQYGEVINNNDGTFAFRPLDDFQFLEEGESRDLTFQYVAIDDSGTVTDTSIAKTATITVEGAYDAPIVIEEQALFNSSNQSMWGTGDALQIDWREFYGVSWNESFSETIVNSASLTIVPKITDPFFDETIYGGYSVDSPSVSIGGSTTGRFGISPYFELNSGTVDSSIPVDIDLTYEVQYERGDHISIATGYSVDNDAFFSTASPSITFGVDLVFEFTASGDLSFGSSTFGGARTLSLFPDINIDIDEPSNPGTDVNLLEFSSDTGIRSDVIDTSDGSEWVQQDGEGGYILSHADYDTNLALSFPSIDTTGELTGANRLESTGSDVVAVLNTDLDEILSETTKYFPPMHHDGSEGLDFYVDLPGFVNDLGWDDVNVDLFSVTWDFELIDIDLITTLTAVQDFTLDIEDLALMVELENGQSITGFNMGDVIEFDLPDWDADVGGNADGILDYAIAIDMDAMLNNWTTLDLSVELLARALKAEIGYTSDVVGDNTYSLFGSDNGGFLVAESFELLNVSPIAELFGNEDPAISGFDLIGFNTVTTADGFVIA